MLHPLYHRWTIVGDGPWQTVSSRACTEDVYSMHCDFDLLTFPGIPPVRSFVVGPITSRLKVTVHPGGRASVATGLPGSNASPVHYD